MAQVIPLRSHTFRIDNCIIDDYGAEIGAIGIAIYTVLQRYADRTTGQCWPSVGTIAGKVGLSKNCVKKYLHHLAHLGLIGIAPRQNVEGDNTSNLYTISDPTQTESVRRLRQQGGASHAGGRAPGALGVDNVMPQGRAPGALGVDNVMPQGRAPGAPDQDPVDQDPVDQETLTSVLTPNMLGKACENPAHEHRSPIPGLQMCIECFQHWPVPLMASPPAGDTERHEHA